MKRFQNSHVRKYLESFTTKWYLRFFLEFETSKKDSKLQNKNVQYYINHGMLREHRRTTL